MEIFNTRNEMFESFSKGLKICELGVFEGDFSKIIFEKCEVNELVLVDMFEGNFGSGDKDGNNYHYVNLNQEHEKLINYFKENDNVKIIKSSTTDFLVYAKDNYFDIVYIDADHSYSGVLSDLTLSYLTVKKNGLICGHDYVKGSDVEKDVFYFCETHNLKINILTNDKCPSYGIIKI